MEFRAFFQWLTDKILETYWLGSLKNESACVSNLPMMLVDDFINEVLSLLAIITTIARIKIYSVVD